MNRVFHIAKREYIETAKTKIFLISVFLTPVLIGGIMFFTSFMQKRIDEGPRPEKSIAVVDLSGALEDALATAFDDHNEAHPQRLITPTLYGVDDAERVDRLKADVRSGDLAGCLVVAEDALKGPGPSRFFMKTQGIEDMKVFSTVRGLLRRVVVDARARTHGLSPELVADIQRPVPVTQVDVTEDTEQEGPRMAQLMMPFFFLFLMFMGVMGTSQGMLTSVIEEKNSRVIEVLLSSVSPFQLMLGKILGLGAIGLTVVLLWGVAAGAAAAHQGMTGLINAANLGYFIGYFILGFLLFSSMFAAVGAACNTLKEAQPLMTPIMIIIVTPMMAWFYIAQYPNAPLALGLSFFPLTAPMVMILRLSAKPDLPAVQIAATFLVLAASVVAVMWAAGKVFRTGILMYGKPPSLRELLRWVRRN